MSHCVPGSRCCTTVLLSSTVWGLQGGAGQRRGSRPFLSPGTEVDRARLDLVHFPAQEAGRGRRDSLSPDSATEETRVRRDGSTDRESHCR